MPDGTGVLATPARFAERHRSPRRPDRENQEVDGARRRVAAQEERGLDSMRGVRPGMPRARSGWRPSQAKKHYAAVSRFLSPLTFSILLVLED